MRSKNHDKRRNNMRGLPEKVSHEMHDKSEKEDGENKLLAMPGLLREELGESEGNPVERAKKAIEDLKKIEDKIAETRRSMEKELEKETERLMVSQYRSEYIKRFLEEPYAIIPGKRQNEWRIVVPRFVDFSVGWLEKQTPAWNIFLINKYTMWFTKIPENIERILRVEKPIDAKIIDGVIVTKEREEVWKRYRRYLSKREGEEAVRIKRGLEFELLAKMIDDGILPFAPRAVEEEDLKEPKTKFDLRDYQEKAWEEFKKWGAIMICWPFSAGKTFIGMHALASLKGEHLVVVPTRTLIEQWRENIMLWTDPETAYNTKIVTYRSFEKVRNKKWMLTIFDEVHRLPANTYSRMATINTKYRIGLSGTPYREDGRSGYVIALSGVPHGIDWTRLIETGIIQKPKITVYIVPSVKAKMEKIRELLIDPIKTLIFCDSIELGRKIAEENRIPHVYGATDGKERMRIMKEENACVVSRVADEGVSLPEIKRVIEADFLFGSRRQEAQRMGRVLHGREIGEHIVLMTPSELEKYEKRFYSIYEKGFNINVVWT